MNHVGVRGDLLKWAREEQELTMRWIHDHGGPSLGYQSEVENGKKGEVSSGVLMKWVRLLGVTEAFARGEVPQFRSDPLACRGLAGKVCALIRADRNTDWPGLSALERILRVLCMTADHSTTTPRVVLAHVLGISVRALDDMLLGQLAIGKTHKKALIEMTTLPDAFFDYGLLETPDETLLAEQYKPVIREAFALGISPDALRDLLRSR